MVALNTAYAAPKNRVGDFFYEDNASVRKNRWSNRLNTQEKSSYHYETASGRSNWSNRDPIEEQGGFNLYGFNYNNGISNYDPNGEEPCTAILISVSAWTLIEWTIVSVIGYFVLVEATETAIETWEDFTYNNKNCKCESDGTREVTITRNPPRKDKRCKNGVWRVGNCGRDGPTVPGCPDKSPFAMGSSRREAQQASLRGLPSGCHGSGNASYHHCTAHECVKGKWVPRM